MLGLHGVCGQASALPTDARLPRHQARDVRDRGESLPEMPRAMNANKPLMTNAEISFRLKSSSRRKSSPVKRSVRKFCSRCRSSSACWISGGMAASQSFRQAASCPTRPCLSASMSKRGQSTVGKYCRSRSLSLQGETHSRSAVHSRSNARLSEIRSAESSSAMVIPELINESVCSHESNRGLGWFSGELTNQNDGAIQPQESNLGKLLSPRNEPTR